MGPLALIAHQSGHEISGSDKQDSQYLAYLQDKGLHDIHVGQSAEAIESLHQKKPIDWIVFSSAVLIENADHPELIFAKKQEIRTSKRDELLNKIIADNGQKLIAIAGTHGKTTTTAMVVWLLKQSGQPLSYSVGAKLSFGDMGQFDSRAEYFVYECDEFDRNFLAFHPYLSLISGISWDHHEIFPTSKAYNEAFHQFIGQSEWTILWPKDMKYLNLQSSNSIFSPDPKLTQSDKLTLVGQVNRENGWLAIQAVAELTQEPYDKLASLMNNFPSLSRRMEQLVPGLYSDYAHTPEKIRGAIETALEIVKDDTSKLVIVYEPLTNRRQHYIKKLYSDLFRDINKLYWVPSFLTREDPAQKVLTPADLIANMTNPQIAEPADMNDNLKQTIQKHLDQGDQVVCLTGGGGGSLDEWLRANFVRNSK